MSCPNVKESACPKKTCPNNSDKSNRNHYEVLKKALLEIK